LSGRSNQVRIIGGSHRGRRLHFKACAGLRPTPDRVRETLFNWLGAELAGARCLDLFAGSGALGIEALSRGAATLLAVERNRGAARALRDNFDLLGLNAELRQVDVLRLLREQAAAPFDIVFADPPFADDCMSRLWALLAGNGWLAAPSWLYAEQDAQRPWPALPPDWTIHREGRAGQSGFRLLRCNRVR
jgi:16S rRNA (guanine966-N2)-methyltransferase